MSARICDRRGKGMGTAADTAELLLQELSEADQRTLVALAQEGRGVPAAPAFRGRCLEPAYLEAVASGDWTADDEALLTRVLEHADATTVPRVGRRHRRNLRVAVEATAVSLLTEKVASPNWQRRRTDLARAWVRTLGPLPSAACSRSVP
jgi:hypothetical protein